MTIAIEPMITAGAPQTRTLSDKWTVVTADGSLAAHFEHTVAITPGRAHGSSPGRRKAPANNPASQPVSQP